MNRKNLFMLDNPMLTGLLITVLVALFLKQVVGYMGYEVEFVNNVKDILLVVTEPVNVWFLEAIGAIFA